MIVLNLLVKIGTKLWLATSASLSAMRSMLMSVDPTTSLGYGSSLPSARAGMKSSDIYSGVMTRSSLDYVTEIPGPWRLMLHWASSRLDRQAAIAGGAVRECLLRKPQLIKDVDIWLCTDMSGEDAWQSLNKLLSSTSHEVKLEAVLKAKSPDLEWLLKVKVDGVGYDILNQKKANGYDCQHLLESFDYGICMCAVNEAGVWTHPLYHKDVHARCITYHATNRTREDKWRSVTDHLERIRGKYPDWGVRNIPEVGMDDLQGATGFVCMRHGSGGGY